MVERDSARPRIARSYGGRLSRDTTGSGGLPLADSRVEVRPDFIAHRCVMRWRSISRNKKQRRVLSGGGGLFCCYGGGGGGGQEEKREMFRSDSIVGADEVGPRLNAAGRREARNTATVVSRESVPPMDLAIRCCPLSLRSTRRPCAMLRSICRHARLCCVAASTGSEEDEQREGHGAPPKSLRTVRGTERHEDVFHCCGRSSSSLIVRKMVGTVAHVGARETCPPRILSLVRIARSLEIRSKRASRHGSSWLEVQTRKKPGNLSEMRRSPAVRGLHAMASPLPLARG